MKHLAILTLHFSLLTLHSSAAVPLSWNVELTAQPPQVFSLQRPRGESYELEAVLKNSGKPFAQAITNACIYWQTNGMENLYWSAPASVSNNVLRASWLPSMDPGAMTVRGYIGDPGRIYAAAFQFRFIASPGATPNALPLPTPVIDFAKVRVLNPPWGSGGGGGVDTNAVRDIAREEIVPATNRLNQTLIDAIDAKRDKDDLDIKLPSIESCTWGTPDTELRDALIGVVPVFSNGKWSAVAGQWTSNLVPGTGYEESISFLFSGLRDDAPANATLVRGEPETVDTLATTNGVNAAIEAHHDGTKRDLTDNTCHKTEFGEWSHDHQTSFGEVGQPSFNNGKWNWKDENGNNVLFASGTEDDTDLYFRDVDNTQEIQLHSTRSKVCTDGKKFVTSDVVDGKVSSAVSTNNPAFVSAVRNTPAPEPGQGEDPPWGTWGTVGAAIAGLVAGLKWLKDKVFDSAGNIQDQFAADLLGKQVANAKVRYALSTTSSATMDDRTVNIYTLSSGTVAMVFPTATTHDGKTYARDFLLKLTYSGGTLQMPQGVTKVGDELSFEAGKTYLIAFTEIAADKFYVRSIDITEAQA